MVVSALVVHPRDRMPRSCAATAQHHEGIVWHIAAPGKDQNSESEVWFLKHVYRFCTFIK